MQISVSNLIKKLWHLCRVIALALLVGVLCGAVGAAFAHAISWVSHVRTVYPSLLYGLPLAGLLTVAIYMICGTSGIGTRHILDAGKGEGRIPLTLTPAVFIGAALTHLCGGSAGREGAALQLGGGLAALVGRVFRVDVVVARTLTICGMGAFFAAVFGTPLGACVFVLEVLYLGRSVLVFLLPTLVSCISAYIIAVFLGVHPEQFTILDIPAVSFSTLWRLLVIAVACALVSVIFCKSLHFVSRKYAVLLKNEWWRIAVGGAVIVVLTLIVGTTDYNGSGITLINRIFEGEEVRYEAFALKILFTVITVAAGYKGGEIIPSFCIGATLGGTLSLLLQLPTTFGAAIGMTAMFCGVTGAPLATAFLAVEMFGIQGIVFFALAIVVSALISGKNNLYTA